MVSLLARGFAHARHLNGFAFGEDIPTFYSGRSTAIMIAVYPVDSNRASLRSTAVYPVDRSTRRSTVYRGLPRSTAVYRVDSRHFRPQSAHGYLVVVPFLDKTEHQLTFIHNRASSR